MNPLVSIILPVYNCENYIREALESIINQSYNNIEIIIINDGSVDNSLQIINSIKDDRIKIFSSEKNKGLIYSLNLGLQHSKGEFIARMDADDIALSNRIEEQVNFLIKNVDVDLCGTWAETFSGDKITGIWKQPISKKEIDCSLLFFASFIHPTIMFKKSSAIEVNFYYNDDFKYAEDYELWCRLMGGFNMVNIPKVLLKYRHHELQISSSFKKTQEYNTFKAAKLYFSKYFDNKDVYIELYEKILNQNYSLSLGFLNKVEELFAFLEARNRQNEWFDNDILNHKLSQVFFMICTHLSSNNINTLKIYFKSNYKSIKYVDKYYFIKYLIKNLKLIGQ